MSDAVNAASDLYQRQSTTYKIAVPVAIVMTILVIAMWAGFVPSALGNAHIPAALGSVQDVIRASFQQIKNPAARYRPVPQGVAEPYRYLGGQQAPGHYKRQGANMEYDLRRAQGANSEIDLYSRLHPQGANSELDIMSYRGPQGANSELDILSNRGPQGSSGIGGVALDAAYSTSYNKNGSPDVPDLRVGAPVWTSSVEDDAQLLTDAYGGAYKRSA